MAQVMLREYLQEIEDTLSAGNVDDAASKCQHILARFPESLEVQRLLGEVYLARGQMDDAQQALDWILTNDPENVIAYCDRALISERLMDLDTALDCYQQAYELSRGNRDIRQQFNLLSLKAGQQGFMFSRAGLARLYMRGGLLPQSIQEWDAVLAVSPDRLDARTGLLEAYWREELYDEAEQVAQQILQDVPGCVKALLLLAHITAPKNMQQAREYVQRGELLDPDLLMAQELFEDMIMRQPGHPFLKLLKKAPTMVDIEQGTIASSSSQVPAEPVFAHASVSQEASRASDASIYDMPTSINLFDWNDPNSWQSAVETPSQSDALPTWSHDTFSDAWTLPDQPQETQEPQKHEHPSLSEQHLDSPAASATSATSATSPTQQEEHAWSNLDSLAGLRSNGSETQQAPEPVWVSGAQDGSLATPPAWLNMLTQDETRSQSQSADATPTLPEELHQPSIETPAQSDTIAVSEDKDSDSSWRDSLQASLDATVDEESFSFGPEWLKSLGAAELEPDVHEQPVSASHAQAQTLPQAVGSTRPLHEETEHAPETYESPEATDTSLQEPMASEHSWLDALSAEPEQQYSEQTIVNTLEDLESNLLSEGFVPLEPNSLATIAQSEDASLNTHTTLPSPLEERQEEEPYAQTTLSSALEQLGNLAMPRTPYQAHEAYTPAIESSSVQSEEEPLWAAHFRSVPAPLQEQHESLWQESYYTPSIPVEALQEDVTTKHPMPPMLVEQNIVSQEQQTTQPYNVNDIPQPIFEPTQEPQQVEAPDVSVSPLGRANAFFDSELETTMKRPAVRLQAMRQPQQSIVATPSLTNRGRSSQFISGGGREGAQRLQQRLVQGYQHQLVGDYDEAMQEYRIIVKNAPELLGEVVSNVRALLKVAPQYSAGYRVLGDAYMRQGEYLQAMEAYNNALTMAKKAKV